MPTTWLMCLRGLVLMSLLTNNELRTLEENLSAWYNTIERNDTAILAHINAPMGTLIAFAAAPGAVAHDGGAYNLKNGVFTHFLKQEILTEGATIDNVLNKVAGQVSKLTNNQQLPYKTGIVTEEFYFKPKANDSPGQAVIAEKPEEPAKPVTPQTYYYYTDQNGNESANRFADRKEAESEMKSRKLNYTARYTAMSLYRDTERLKHSKIVSE